MSLHLKPHDPSTVETLSKNRAAYFQTKDLELAIALNRGLDWSLVGVYRADKTLMHVGVRNPRGTFFDARGEVSANDFSAPFGSDLSIIDIEDENKLKHQTRLIIERDIISAGMLAMTIWPDLPWKEETYIQALKRFAVDLEKLSRKHGFWLSSNGDWPVIQIEQGQELGYEISLVDRGTVNVNLKTESA